jgi:peptidoglycan/xylan/chitin deacetylase (PgdA/CDA1 family)
MYHRFGSIRGDVSRTFAGLFEKQVVAIKNNFCPMSLSEFQVRIARRESIPPNTVILTIDDGYGDFFTYAFPILRKYRVPATVFVTCNFVEGKKWLWPDIIEFILMNSRFREISVRDGEFQHSFSLVGAENLRKAWSEIAEYCLAIGHSRATAFIDELGRDLDIQVPENPTADYCGLTWSKIREMMREGVEIGSHTNNHPRLTMLDERALAHEIVDSKRHIENAIDREVSFFAFPFGSKSDIDSRTKQMVREAGYKMAFAAYFGNNFRKDVFEINRIAANDDWRLFTQDIHGKKVIEYVYQELFS